jgi:diadenosine tetraphosphatase ApaH/serine/threonine PP2A family protein phosphatase
MRLALMSDIHANLHAFEACLEHAKLHAVTHYAFLGDFVGYGAYPNEVLTIINKMSLDGAFVIKGNHDEMALNPHATELNLGSISSKWTHDQISQENLEFITTLPFQLVINDFLLVHASANQPEKWFYVDNEVNASNCLEASANIEGIKKIFVGHVHEQHLYYQGTSRTLMKFSPTLDNPIPLVSSRRYVTCIGSVGQPRDNDPKAMYVIYDHELEKLSFHRINYDVAKASEAIRQKGLPEFFAHRLEIGK